ncbi:MAG: hypothetical protein ACRECW_14380 [Phyllobacterium sp.]
MRFLSFLLLTSGLLLGFGYPWYIRNFSGTEIGTIGVYDRPGPFRPVTIALNRSDAPVRILVDMQPIRGFIPAEKRTALTGVVEQGGNTLIAKQMTFVDGFNYDRNSPQGPRVFRQSLGDINPVVDGDYVIRIAEGDYDGLQVERVDLVIQGNVLTADPRAMPAGIAMVIVGAFGFVRFRRRKSPQNPNSQEPPEQRWGRQ